MNENKSAKYSPFNTVGVKPIAHAVGNERSESSGSTAPERQQSQVHPKEAFELGAGLTATEQAHTPVQREARQGIKLLSDAWQEDETEEEVRQRVHAELEERQIKNPSGDPQVRTRMLQQGFLAPTAAEQAALVRQEKVAEKQKEELAKFDQISSLDWKQIPPPMLAQILISIPFKGSSSDPDYYLTPVQGMIFALRCFELGLSPFSNEVWFNSKNNKVNVTFEGKLKLARMNGLNLSPPLFERMPADPSKPLVAYKCTIVAPYGKCEYTATLKEWFVARSPVWKEKPDHMLQLRAAEKCLSFATGSGSSELMGEQDLQTGKEVESFIPSFTQEGNK